PLPARARLLVDDHHERRDPGRAEVADHPVDERHACDGDEGFGHRKPGRAQTAALAGRDDPAPALRHSSSPASSPSERITRSLAQQARGGDVVSPASQMWAMPMPRAPAMSRGSESPTNVTASGCRPSLASACWKIRGSGFVQPTSVESTITLNSG